MKDTQNCRAYDGADQSSRLAVNYQAQFSRGVPVRPNSPNHYSYDQPLKRDCRSIQRNSFRRTDARKRQQTLETHPPPPRHNYSEKKKDEPEVPRHSAMKSLLPLSCNSAQGTVTLHNETGIVI